MKKKLLDSIARHLVAWLVGSALLIAAVAVAVMVVISRSYQAPAGEEQPKITDWMQAWGSVGGVLAGLLAAGAAAALLMHERKRSAEAERLLAEERAEAALNVPRSVAVTPARFIGYGHAGDQYGQQASFHIYNYGPFVIRNVQAVVVLPEDGPCLILRPFTVIGPGANEAIRQGFAPVLKIPASYELSKLRATVRVCFIDHVGQPWQVTSDGQISRTTVPYPAVDAAAAVPGTVRLDTE